MIQLSDLRHPLYVLTKSQFDHIKSNNILIRDFVPLNVDTSLKKVRHAFYKLSREDVGDNIAPYFKILKHDNFICLDTVKRNFLSITMEIDPKLCNDSMLCLIGDKLSNSRNMVLLFLATYNNNLPKASNIKDFSKLFRQNRFNINGSRTSGNHFGSSGESYGIGFVPKYRQNQFGLTFGQYAEKKRRKDRGKIDRKMTNIMLNYLDDAKALPCMIIPKVYEKMMAFDIATQKYLSIIFTGITSINSMTDETEIKSFMSSQMNINVTTLIPHTEMDRSSTLIYVPVQPNKNQDYGFEVKFNHFTSMTIKLIEGTTILYSAYMITHRQIKVDETYSKLNTTKTNHCKNIPQNDASQDEFINISTYYSTRLYSHIKSSIQRIRTQREIEQLDVLFL